VGGAAALVGLAACSPNDQNSSAKDSAKPETAGNAKTYEPTEVIDADVVVVGSGSSGMCATVQAAELGAKTYCLEKNAEVGGNGRGTEGIFALGTSAQRDAGVQIPTFREIIATDAEFFNYRINSLFWVDMVSNSADNWEWLVGNGVKFSGVVDNYGVGGVPCFHWFVDANGGDSYIEPMAAKAEELGATIMTSTPVVDLVITDGAVTGVYAEREDGSVIQINAKGVILASGGYANNVEMMEARGYDMTYTINQGRPGHDGDGLRMAVAAGAQDVSLERCFLRDPYTYGLNFFLPFSFAVCRGGPMMWVNQDAERYVNEACGSVTPGNNSNAVHTQKVSWLIFDQAQAERFAETTENFLADLADAVAQCPGDNIYQADTIEALAGAAKLDPATLKATLERYNELAKSGVDEDFNKPAEKMFPLETPPYYIFRQDMSFWTSIGGIHTNRKFQAVDVDGNPVPGLYAVGTDGCELYRETYTMNIPASCQGNNCNSGRMAAKEICAAL
jgi:fumarate reductase flavoprotein subunit